MLVLSRRIGETICIDDGAVRATVTEIETDTASVWFVANGIGFLFKMRVDEPVDLTRYSGGRFCTVMLTRIEAGRLRLGFEAPSRVVIDREEIFHLKNETTWGVVDGSDGAKEGSGRRAGACGEDHGTVRRSSETRAAI